MKKKSKPRNKNQQTLEEMMASAQRFVFRGQEEVSNQTLRLNADGCPFDQERIVGTCLSCGFNDVNCWHGDALHKLAFGLGELSQALKHVLEGARYTAVDIQRTELGGPQPVVLLDWSTTSFPDDTVPAFEALRHFHVVGRYYGPYKSIEEYLADTGLFRFIVFAWSPEEFAWLPERRVKKAV